MRLAILLPAFVLAIPGAVYAAPSILVTPTLAPNAFGSPSYTSWVANSVGALHDGATSRGDPTLPTYYQAQSVVTATESIVTGFASWKGVADPGTAFGSAYANELGNRMLFGVRIDGQGTQFAISGLSFTAVSSDAANALGFSNAAGFYNYSTQYEGVLKGADGILFTADDIYITSGTSDQLVDGLVGRGSGSSFAAYCDGCTTAQQQAAIYDAASYITAPTTFTGTYSLFSNAQTRVQSGSNSFTILPSAANVPEPASWTMMIGGFGLVGASLRRQRRTHRATFA